LGGRRAPVAPAERTDVAAARARAIGMLARRDYSRKALEGRLHEAGFEPATAALAVEALADERLVDESRYIEQAVASRAARGQGPQRIMLELARLGVDPTLIASAVDAHAPAWADLAADLRRRRFGSAVPRAPRERARQIRFLLYRGFRGEQVRAALGVVQDESIEELELE